MQITSEEIIPCRVPLQLFFRNFRSMFFNSRISLLESFPFLGPSDCFLPFFCVFDSPIAVLNAVLRFDANLAIDISLKCLSSFFLWKDHLSFLRFPCFAMVTSLSNRRVACRILLHSITSSSR